MWNKNNVVYRYTFYSDSLSDDDVELFLKKEIYPIEGKAYYRADYHEFKIHRKEITFDRNSSWIASKQRLIKELQKKLNTLTLIKKYNDILR